MSEDRPLLSKLLPLELSAYINDYLAQNSSSASAPPPSLPPLTTLQELAHILRLHENVEQKRNQSRIRLHRALVSSSLSTRILQCGQSCYKTLIDYYRNDDKHHFAQLHNALHDVRMSVDAYRRYSLLESSSPSFSSTAKIPPQGFSTFFHEIPLKSRMELLAFLSELRCNPDFLAARICSLSENHLLSLLSFRPAPPDFLRLKHSSSLLNPVARPVKRLLSFHRHDSLASLTYSIFANSSGPDSAEDLRRTDCWATTGARLILENKPGWDRFMPRLLDIWADMREWPAKHQFEQYLMQVLQDGQFLLTSSPTKKSSQYATEEYFNRCVKNLMILLDADSTAGGLPNGILEISHAILAKLSPSQKHRRLAEVFIVVHCFFGSFLYHALLYPEINGIMLGYHISQFARENILKEIASRVHRQVVAIFNNIRVSTIVLPEVQKHVDTLFDHLKKPSSSRTPFLSPAKTVIAPKETIEVQPFLVLSPWDLVTLVKSLFPERKSSSLNHDSILSQPVSCAASEVTSINNDFDENENENENGNGNEDKPKKNDENDIEDDHFSSLPAEQRHAAMIRPVPTEEYGRKLRVACLEMSQAIGLDAAPEISHPCADRWAVLHISSDGKQIFTRMRKDVCVDDEDTDDDFSDSDSNDGEHSKTESNHSRGLVLEYGYHYLKESISKLLLEYDLPKGWSDSTAFSNGQISKRKKKPTSTKTLGNAVQQPNGVKSREAELMVMLNAAYEQCQSRGDFVNSHIWWKALEILKNIDSPSLMTNDYAALLHLFARGPRESSSRCFSAIEEFDACFIWLTQSESRHQARIDVMLRDVKDLRDSMWYKTMVVHSAGYEEARSLVRTLRLMGQNLRPEPITEPHSPPIPQPVPSFIRSRFLRAPHIQEQQPSHTLLKTESQVMELLAAPDEQCGPNKLSDDQVDMTNRWFHEEKIDHQFCRCEERIHRFNMEIFKCVSKLAGYSPTDCPVLWSSELFKREQYILNGGQTDMWLTDMGLCVSDPNNNNTEDDRDTMSKKSASFFSLDLPQKSYNKDSIRSIRSGSSIASRPSLAETGWTGGACNNNIMDSRDYFGISSPALDIDSSVTFWSPVQSTSDPTKSFQASNISATSLLPQKPSSAVNEEEKELFVQDLRRTLTSLLVSDLGAILLEKGSETDAWLSDELVLRCMKVRNVELQKRSMKLARKKSRRKLREAHSQRIIDSIGAKPSLLADNIDERPPSIPSTDKSKNISTNPATAFPFNDAYIEILRRFSIQPSPYAKLEALTSLRLLMDYQLSPPTKMQHLRTRINELTDPRNSPSVDIQISRAPGRSSAGKGQASHGGSTGRVSNGHSNGRISTERMSDRASPNDTSTLVRGTPSCPGAAEILNSILSDPNVRPKTFFRDLQYVSTFVPAHVLERGSHGRAFIDVSVAAVSFKDDIVRFLVEVADEVVSKDASLKLIRSATIATSKATTDSNQREEDLKTSAGANASGHTDIVTDAGTDHRLPDQQQQDQIEVEPSRNFTMAEAARMYHIAALEGNATAARELAIFYLTRPEITPRSMQPFAKAGDVFRRLPAIVASSNKAQTTPQSGGGMLGGASSRLSSFFGGGSAFGGEDQQKDQKVDRACGKDTSTVDPVCLLLAEHWMQKGRDWGDALAKDYLNGRDGLDGMAHMSIKSF